MSDLFSLAVIGGFILLLIKFGKKPEPVKDRSKYRSLPPYRVNNNDWNDEEDED